MRAIAAFFVIISHSIRVAEDQYSANDESLSYLPINLFDLGTYGVYLFFALSGFTLYINYSERIYWIRDFGIFYVKRLLRIWPAFALSLITYILFIEIFKIFYEGSDEQWIAQFLNNYSLINITQYLSLTFNITGPRDLFNGAYWSLPVEFQYYLLLPFCIIFMKWVRQKYFVPMVFAGYMYLIYYSKMVAFDSLEVFKMSFTFFGGVLLADIYKYINHKISSLLALVIIMLLLLVTGLIRTQHIVIDEAFPFLRDIKNTYGVLAVLTICVALMAKELILPEKLRVLLTKYGKVSYSIYLFHMLFVGFSSLIIIELNIMDGIKKFFVCLTITSIGSYYLSLLTYKYVEKPFVRLGKKFYSTSGKQNISQKT